MHNRPIARACLAAAALAIAVAALAAPSAAIVPPTDCGVITVKHKRYDIKADQLRCKTAKPHAARYLSTHRRPAGYRCRDFGRETKLKFRCSRGVKVFFAIRR
jgi:hypothetical protein